MAAIEPRVDKTIDTLKSPHAVSGQKKLDSVRQPDLTPINKKMQFFDKKLANLFNLGLCQAKIKWPLVNPGLKANKSC